MAKFLIADDHPLYREALVSALLTIFENVEMLQSFDLDSTLETLQLNSDIDLVLLDLGMPGCDKFEGVTEISRCFPDIPVAVISATDSISTISKVMALGANGFIPKSTSTTVLAKALIQIKKGGTWLPDGIILDVEGQSSSLDLFRLVAELTPKQTEVLKLVQEGLLNKQIAYNLHISEATVKAHLSAIFRKLNVNTRTQVVLLLKQLEVN